MVHIIAIMFEFALFSLSFTIVLFPHQKIPPFGIAMQSSSLDCGSIFLSIGLQLCSILSYKCSLPAHGCHVVGVFFFFTLAKFYRFFCLLV